MKTIFNVVALGLLTTLLPLIGYAESVAESFDLEVALATPYNHDFTMLTTVITNQPFEMIATNGGITNKVSGTLLAPTNGVYPLDLTVSEWVSEKSNMRDTANLKLELGKVSGYGSVSSFIYMRSVTLRKHESHLTTKQ